jgi:hypothetical protein
MKAHIHESHPEAPLQPFDTTIDPIHKRTRTKNREPGSINAKLLAINLHAKYLTMKSQSMAKRDETSTIIAPANVVVIDIDTAADHGVATPAADRGITDPLWTCENTRSRLRQSSRSLHFTTMTTYTNDPRNNNNKTETAARIRPHLSTQDAHNSSEAPEKHTKFSTQLKYKD